MTTPSRITVTVDDDHLAGVEELAGRLRAAGMDVDQVLATVGIITGSVDPSRRSSLEGVTGVASVDEEMSYQLPPPEADIQ